MQSDIDTVVVPAGEDTFQTIWLKEKRWAAIKMDPANRSRIKYIAVYRKAPHSAITSVAKVRSIEPWDVDPEKVVVIFEGEASEIGPIPFVKKSKRQLRGPRYANYERLLQAQSLDDIWG